MLEVVLRGARACGASGAGASVPEPLPRDPALHCALEVVLLGARALRHSWRWRPCCHASAAGAFLPPKVCRCWRFRKLLVLARLPQDRVREHAGIGRVASLLHDHGEGRRVADETLSLIHI
eukprot:11949835-Alexandrium_andersonii.AAC.1